MKSFIFILGLLAFVQEKSLGASIEAEEVIDEEWESFKLKFNKSYDSNADELFRRKVFMENKRIIAEHNARYYEGKHNFTLKMNHFGDMLRNEYSSKFIFYSHNLDYLRYSFVAVLSRNDEWSQFGFDEFKR